MQQIKSNKNIIYKRNSTFTCLFTMDRRKYYVLMTQKSRARQSLLGTATTITQLSNKYGKALLGLRESVSSR